MPSRAPIIYRLKDWLKARWPLLVAAVIPLIILGPLLGRGYVLTYDMIFGPHLSISWQSFNDGRSLLNALPLQLVITGLNHVMPADIVQKLILYAIFFLGIFGFNVSLPLRSRLARIVGGLFYTVNPFTYDRFMAGHWIFLLAYSLTPFALRAFYDLFTIYSRRRLLRAAVIWALIAMVSLHHVVILGLLFIAVAVAVARTKLAVLRALGVVGLTLGFCSWWLLPTMFGANFTHSFGLADYHAFASKPDPTYGIWLTLISLQGFWYTAWHGLRDVGQWWPVITGLWLAPVWIGLGTALRARQQPTARLLFGLGGLALVCLILAAGPNEPVGGFNSWLFLHVPGLRGLRESQKLLSLVALFYASAVAFGIDYLGQRGRWVFQIAAALFTLVMVTGTSFYLFWGAHSQLYTVQYPEAWGKFYQYLQTRPPDEHVLVLPYELYLNKTFAQRLIANPAGPYFGSRVITSDDPKLPGLPAVSLPKYEALSAAIQRRDTTALMVEANALHVRYIMLITSDDSADYSWINRAPHTLLLQSSQLSVITLTAN